MTVIQNKQFGIHHHIERCFSICAKIASTFRFTFSISHFFYFLLFFRLSGCYARAHTLNHTKYQFICCHSFVGSPKKRRERHSIMCHIVIIDCTRLSCVYSKRREDSAVCFKGYRKTPKPYRVPTTTVLLCVCIYFIRYLYDSIMWWFGILDECIITLLCWHKNTLKNGLVAYLYIELCMAYTIHTLWEYQL